MAAIRLRSEMPQLPTGTVTFMFTDIEGSTRLLQRVGESYADLLADHNRILRDAIAAGGGAEVQTEGDSFFAVFPPRLGRCVPRSKPSGVSRATPGQKETRSGSGSAFTPGRAS